MAITFLQAEWRKLALANYAVPPEVLLPYLPAGTQLDIWNNTCYVSLVGFMFQRTRLLGVRVPFHVNFEEVNLRFYVTEANSGELKRGVVFIKEIVPKPALTWVANTLYKEHYQTMPMRHQWNHTDDNLHVQYAWFKQRWHSFSVQALANSSALAPGSEAEFITEHYWGYTRQGIHHTGVYAVEHPKWEIYPVQSFQVDADFGLLYGEDFAFLNQATPRSVFLAEGSPVLVKSGNKLRVVY